MGVPIQHRAFRSGPVSGRRFHRRDRGFRQDLFGAGDRLAARVVAVHQIHWQVPELLSGGSDRRD